MRHRVEKNIYPKWLIVDFADNNCIKNLKSCLIEQSIQYHYVDDFRNFDIAKINKKFKRNDCIIFYGPILSAREVQNKTSFVPGVYYNYINFCCNVYFSYFGNYLLNKDYLMLPFQEIPRRKTDVFKKNRQAFIRPNSGHKTFDGQVVHEDDFDIFQRDVEINAGLPIQEIIAVSAPVKPIEKEWRCVICGHKTIAYSQYISNEKIDMKPCIEEGALDLSNRIAKYKWSPDKIFVVDICKSNAEYFLLEINSFSMSSLYECNWNWIIPEIHKIAIKDWQLQQTMMPDHNKERF